MKKFFNNIGNSIKDIFKNFIGIFSETSPTSMMRFMSFFIFWFSIYEIDYILKTYGNNLDQNHIFIIVALLVFSFFPKVAQKAIEKKI
jgi:hypothetical protein